MSLALVGPASAKDKKNKNDETVNQILEVFTDSPAPKEKKKHDKRSENVDPFDAIRDYLSGYRKTSSSPKSLPPGLVKKQARGEELPPGWKNQIYRNEVFPDNLFRLASPLDRSTIPKFGNSDSKVDYYSLGDRIFKVNRSDRRVLDFMDLD